MRILPAAIVGDRARLFAFCTILAAVNGAAVYIVPAIQEHGTIAAVFQLAGVSAVFWFALYAVAQIARDTEAQSPLHRFDGLVAGLIVAAALLPIAAAGALAVTGAGAWLLTTAPVGTRERRIAIVLLAISGSLLWGRILLGLFAPLLLGADSQLVGLLSGLDVQGNSVAFASSDKRFIVGPGCSSLHAISLAIVLWAAVTQLLDMPIGPATLGACGAAIGAMVLVNGARLATIGHFPADFDYWHDGAGAGWFGWAGLIASGLALGIGLGIAQRARN